MEQKRVTISIFIQVLLQIFIQRLQKQISDQILMTINQKAPPTPLRIHNSTRETFTKTPNINVLTHNLLIQK